MSTAQPETYFLLRMVENPRLENEWLDLLSQLEYVGFRKIANSVSYENVNVEVLQHVQEESLHALLLKRVAEERGLSPHRPWSENPFSKIGFEYFQTLDQTLSAELPPRDCYPAVSWAVEQRVLQVYPHYLELTPCPKVSRALRQILAQEKRHGGQFDQLIFPPGFRERAVEIEKALWERFSEKMEKTLQDLSH